MLQHTSRSCTISTLRVRGAVVYRPGSSLSLSLILASGVPALLNEEVPITTTTVTYNGVDLRKYANRLTIFLAEAAKDHVQQHSLKLSIPYKPLDKPTARHESETAVLHIYLFYFPMLHGKEVRVHPPYARTRIDSQ